MKLSTQMFKWLFSPNGLPIFTALALGAGLPATLRAEAPKAPSAAYGDLGNPAEWDAFSEVVKGSKEERAKALADAAARKTAATAPPLQELAAKVVPRRRPPCAMCSPKMRMRSWL
ncbi:MAG: hypothetical protein EOP11_16180 [Proteobacteria bacterium]|nr:MAG: hypothetical protein EOP11_16180 [Pseudomonadota bacterium]